MRYSLRLLQFALYTAVAPRSPALIVLCKALTVQLAVELIYCEIGSQSFIQVPVCLTPELGLIVDRLVRCTVHKLAAHAHSVELPAALECYRTDKVPD